MKCEKCGNETPDNEISMMTSKGVWCVACVGGGVDKLLGRSASERYEDRNKAVNPWVR